jgi:predicted NAD/FAD-binding protein
MNNPKSPTRGAADVRRVAVVGGGISGVAAAHRLAESVDVTMFEAQRRLGGHTDSHSVWVEDKVYTIDTGFVAFHPSGHASFCQWLAQIGVPTQRTDMTFSVRSDKDGREYSTIGWRTFFSSSELLLSPKHWRLLWDWQRFHMEAPKAAEHQGLLNAGEYLRQNNYSEGFVQRHMAPLCAALWAQSQASALDTPLQHLASIAQNQKIFQHPAQSLWQVVSGGASQYLEVFSEQFPGDIRCNSRVLRVLRTDSSVVLETEHESLEFDAVIMACHSDQALDALVEPTTAETDVLGAIKYTDNQVVLHGDAGYMPRDRRNWSSWNARIDAQSGRSETTYWMNRVQGIRGPQFFITLNPQSTPKRIWTERKYRHPVLDADAYQAQQRQEQISGLDRTFYCGAYWGMGGHEDGFRSGIDAAEKLLAKLPTLSRSTGQVDYAADMGGADQSQGG